MHVRSRVPLLKMVFLDTGFPKLRVAQLHLFITHVSVAPVAVRSAASNDSHRRNLDTTPGLGVNS